MVLRTFWHIGVNTLGAPLVLIIIIICRAKGRKKEFSVVGDI